MRSCSKENTSLFSQPFLCLSRACLGKLIVFGTKRLKRRRFPHQEHVADARGQDGARLVEHVADGGCAEVGDSVVVAAVLLVRMLRDPAVVHARVVGFIHAVHARRRVPLVAEGVEHRHAVGPVVEALVPVADLPVAVAATAAVRPCVRRARVAAGHVALRAVLADDLRRHEGVAGALEQRGERRVPRRCRAVGAELRVGERQHPAEESGAVVGERAIRRRVQPANREVGELLVRLLPEVRVALALPEQRRGERPACNRQRTMRVRPGGRTEGRSCWPLVLGALTRCPVRTRRGSISLA
eukprot:COSAG06_NODE_3424_length_5365_cov_15.833080_5_plen_299_part_00